MARRDVELVVRAKDEAAKAVDAISKAINGLVKSQTGLEKSAGKSDTTLSRLGATFSELDRTLKGFTVGQKIAQELDKATAASSKLEKNFSETGKEAAELSKRLASTAESTSKLAAAADKSAVSVSKQVSAVKRAKISQTELNSSLKASIAERAKLATTEARLSASITKQSAKVSEVSSRYRRFSEELKNTSSPTKTLINNVERANVSLDKQKLKLSKMNVAYRKASEESAKAGKAVITLGNSLKKASSSLSLQTAALEKSKISYSELKVSAGSAAKELRRLQVDSDKVGSSLGRQKAGLERAQIEMAQLAAAAGRADASLKELAAGSGVAMQSSFDKQKRSLLETKREWKSYQAEISKVSASISKVGPPTIQVSQAMDRAKIAARATKQEYIAQRIGLSKLSRVLRQSGSDIDGLRAKQQAFTAVQASTGRAIAQIRVRAKEAASANDRLATAANRAAKGVKQVGLASRSASTSMKRAASSTRTLKRAYERLYGAQRQSLSIGQRIRGQVLSLTAAYGGFYGVIRLIKGTLSAYQSLEAATSRLNVVFDGNKGKVAKELDFIRRTAERLGFEFGELAQQYTKFAVATKGTVLEGAKTRAIFTSVSEAARVNKINSLQVGRVFVALTQIASKGVITMEELRQQLGDSLPGAVQLFATALGYTVTEVKDFYKEVSKGNISSDSLIDFAYNLNKVFGGQLPASLLTTTTAIGKLRNATFEAYLQFGKSGVISSLDGLIRQLTTTIKSSQFVEFSSAVSKSLGGLMSAVTFAISNFQTLFIILSAYAGLKLAPWLIKLAVGFAGVLVGFTTFPGKVKTAIGVMKLFGAVTGVAVTGLVLLKAAFVSTPWGAGITIAAGALAWYATRTSSATENLVSFRKIIDEITNAFEKSNGKFKKWVDNIKNISLSEVQATLKSLKSELGDVKNNLPDISSWWNRAFGDVGSNIPEDFFLRYEALKVQLELGDITAKEFKNTLAGLFKDGGNFAPEFIAKVHAALDAINELDKKVKQLKAVETLKTPGTTLTKKEEETLKKELNLAGEGSPAYKKQNASDNAAKLSAIKFTAQLTESIRIEGKSPDQLVLDELNKHIKILTEIFTKGMSAQELVTAKRYGSGLGNPLIQGLVTQRAYLKGKIVQDNSQGSAFPSSNIGIPEMLNISADLLGMNETDQWEAIQQYLTEGGAGLDPRVTAWCAAFVNATLRKGGFKGSGSNMAKSFLSVGRGVKTPKVGDIAVYNRGSDSTKGHVAFVVEVSPDGTKVKVRGGNQGRKGGGGVTNRVRPTSDAIAYRRLEGQDRDVLADNLQRKGSKAFQAEQDARNEQLRLADLSELQQLRSIALVNAERAKGSKLTEKQIAATNSVTNALFAQKVAQRNANDIARQGGAAVIAVKEHEEKVNALLKQQAELRKQLKIFQQSGNVEEEEKTRLELEKINVALIDNANKAKEMWEAIGGTNADVAVAKLNTTVASAQNLGIAALEVRTKWDGVDKMFSSGLTNAIDKFSTAVATGKDITEAARQAFLQFAADFLRQIARMIIEQAILNALGAKQGNGGGGIIGNLLGSLLGAGHTGGLVGSKRIGSGNQTRRINPGVFMNAARFHNGGLPGLRAGEVAAVLRKNEEVLTAGDPRHILNGGKNNIGSSNGRATGSVKIVNAIDSGSFIDAGLNSKTGEKAIMNFLQANASAVKSALG